MDGSNTFAETIEYLDRAMKRASQEEIETPTAVPDAGVNDGSAPATEGSHAKENEKEVSDQVGPGSVEDDIGDANKKMPDTANVGTLDAEDPAKGPSKTEPLAVEGDAASTAAVSEGEKLASEFEQLAEKLAEQMAAYIEGKTPDESNTEEPLKEDSTEEESKEASEKAAELVEKYPHIAAHGYTAAAAAVGAEKVKEAGEETLKEAADLFEKYPHVVAQGYAAADGAVGASLLTEDQHKQAAAKELETIVDTVIKQAEADVDELLIPALQLQAAIKQAEEDPESLDPQVAALLGVAEDAAAGDGDEGGAEEMVAGAGEEEPEAEIDPQDLANAVAQALIEQGAIAPPEEPDGDEAPVDGEKEAAEQRKAEVLKQIQQAVNTALTNVVNKK